jgi:excisionase family DNA binding protein
LHNNVIGIIFFGIMIKVNIQEVAVRQGIKTAYQLQKLMSLQPSVASRLFNNKLTMISFGTLDRLCDALDCVPADLIIYTSDKPKAEKLRVEKPAREPQTVKTVGTGETMLTTNEAGERLGLSRKRVNDYIISGELPSVKGKQGHNFIRESDVEEFKKKRAVSP